MTPLTQQQRLLPAHLRAAQRGAALLLLLLVPVLLSVGCSNRNASEVARLRTTISPDLPAARRQHSTVLKPSGASGFRADGPAPAPPPGWRLVRYPSSGRDLVAYLSEAPAGGKGEKHPALLWAHGGFGGVGIETLQEVEMFRQAGLVVMCPSWRGENDNGGNFELFYGEVEDAAQAAEYLAKVPYVDPSRIYMAGHSTGGTITLLTAQYTDRLRAAFPFGGAPDASTIVTAWDQEGLIPFDPGNTKEAYLRSPIAFVKSIRCPIWYFEGAENSPYPPDAERMEERAKQAGKPFRAFTIAGGDHFNIVQPISILLALEMLSDTGPTSGIQITDDEVRRAFRQ